MEIAEAGYVNIENDGQGISTISFFHPAQNSLPAHLLRLLAEAILNAGADVKTTVIILKSDGNHTFCAGASFDELLRIANKEQGLAFFSGFANVINACRTCGKLVIGRVHGKAIGGGAGIAAAADYCFATSNASIKLSELTIGIGPFVIGPALTRKIGLSAFSQLAINATAFYPADWARQQGLYAEVFANVADMDAAIAALAKTLSGYNMESLSQLKKMLWEGTDNWNTFLAGRAAISGELVLSASSQQLIKNIKQRK